VALPPERGIEGVPHAFSQEVVAQDGDEDGETGIVGEPPGDVDVVLARREDVALAWRRRLDADAEKTQG